MRVAIIALGSRGDLEPYLALGKGLADSGHVVRLVTHQNFEPLVSSHGLECWPIEGNVQDTAQNMAGLLEGGNFLAILSHMAKEAQEAALFLAQAGLDACRGMDVLLAGVGGLFGGIALAEKLKLPLIQAYYIPFTPTQAYPSFLAPMLPPLPGRLTNRLTHHLARQMIWQGFRSADNRARRQVLDLPTPSFWGPYNSDCLRGQLVLYGFSPAVIPPTSDWDANTHVTGYWFLEPADDWMPPAALMDFLQDGPPPVYVGFGSMSSLKPEETADLVLRALARSGQRGVVLSGWGGLHSDAVPESVFMVDSIPFSWLFPRLAAVVHHGGAGTTAAGLRAGVPSIVVPFFGDQPYWGRRVEELGVGPAAIPRKKLSVERLAQAIHIAVTDQSMRRRAASLGSTIRAEDGVARAVDLIQRSA
jgi:UDP:flavonoid glycosyltransferase YjiC (YdhE family)